MKILIAYDGFNSVSAAINSLKQAGLPAEAEVCVLTVVNPWSTRILSSEFEAVEGCGEIDDVEIFQGLAKRAASDLSEAFGGWNVHAEIEMNDSPVKGIMQKEEKWNPDLIIMGSHKTYAFERFFLGSVAHSVLVHTKKSVRLVRTALRNTAGPLRIIVGMDGSPYSQRAAYSVAERSWPQGTEVKMITAFDFALSSVLAAKTYPTKKTKAESVSDGEIEWVHSRNETAYQALEEANLKVSEVVKAAQPAALLLREAREWEADCVFVGARGRAALDRFLIGSVSLEVAMKAPCTVEVVRR